MQWTHEQLPVISSLAEIIRIRAFAGAGKTSTLVGRAEANPHESMLYLCFNKSVEVEAKKRFPRNVVCKTGHALAYAAIGSKFQRKLTGNLRVTDIAKLTGGQNWSLARDILGTINNFMASASDKIGVEHYPRPKSKSDRMTTAQRRQIESAVMQAGAIWNRMTDIHDLAAPATHDTYFKMYALSRPDLSQRFSRIAVDEAQDLNPVVASLLKAQRDHGCKIIVVGDQHQQLYRFRGAEDALEASWLDGAEDHYITESFRFGPAIAHVANAILELKGETHKLTGRGPKSFVKRDLPTDLPHRCYLHRTVAGVIETALGHLGSQGKMFWVGGIDSYSLSDLDDLNYLRMGLRDNIKNKKLTQEYRSFNDYQNVAKETEDPEMQRLVRIVETYKNDLPNLVAALRARTTSDELDATITLSTIHKSKGLEWDWVKVCDDFTFEPFAISTDEDADPKSRDDELNLLYVASTRAIHTLAVNSTILTIMQAHVDLHGSNRHPRET